MKKPFDHTKTIYLIDGSTFLYRAYYSMKPLHNSKGQAVQAVYVFCRMLKKLINTFDPHKMVLVWDSKGATERHNIFSGYKDGRQAKPSDLFEQKELIMKFADDIGLAQIAAEGIEADDIINSIVQDFKKNDYNLVIIASDKDLYQLLDNNIFVYDPFKEQLTDKNSYENKLEFTIDKLPFYFAILGDASDNIPGVKGIGKVGATELVKKFNNLEDLYQNLNQILKERVRNLLIENKENAFLSYELFKLRYYKVNLTPEKLEFIPSNWINAKAFFQEFEFKSLLKDLDEVHEKNVEQKPFFADAKGYIFKCITARDDLYNLVEYLKIQKEFAIDTETNGISPFNSDLIGISVCAQKGLAFYIPFGHKIDEEQLSKVEVLSTLKPILEDKKYKKYLHHANFDRLVLFNAGINVNGITFDTLIAADLVLEDGIRLGLKNLSEHFFDEKMLSFEDVVKSKKLKNFSQVQLKEATDYAAADAHQTFMLKEVFEKKLNELNLEKLFFDVEMPLSDILFNMEIEGISIDENILLKIAKKLDEEIKFIENQIFTLANIEPINLNSPKQVEDLLFNHLKLKPLTKSTKGKSFSTNYKVLEELALLHVVPKLLIKHRELSKLKNTYIEALPEYLNKKTNKIHSTFSQTSTATGRLASYEPNLQNIPTDDVGVRSAFKPDANHVFLSADYSQIELRILAYFSQDKNLINAFSKNEDIHSKTASYLFNVPIEKITNEQRQLGKKINFSILYGLTPFGLSKDLKIPFKDAKLYIEKYFEQFPGVSKWMENVLEFAKKNGYVQTLLGRRRHVPGIYEKNKMLYDIASRIAINTPAQGTAADIMKLGMINLSNAFKEHNLKAKILIQIHDELLISVPKEEKDLTEKITKKILETVVSWNIPILVTTRFGNNWQEVTK